MVKMSKELSWGYKRLNFCSRHRYTNKMKNLNILVYGLEQTAVLRNWYTSQTNEVLVVHVGTRWYTLVHVGTRWYTLVHVGTRWYTWYTLVHVGTR